MELRGRHGDIKDNYTAIEMKANANIIRSLIYQTKHNFMKQQSFIEANCMLLYLEVKTK